MIFSLPSKILKYFYSQTTKAKFKLLLVYQVLCVILSTAQDIQAKLQMSVDQINMLDQNIYTWPSVN